MIMRERFIDWAPRGRSLELLEIVQGVITSYAAQGYTLTVRQLYYQLVARDAIPNTERSYKSIIGLLDSARLAGLLDWNSIVDRTRSAYRTDGADTSPEDAVLTLAESYERAKWRDQPNHVEVWVEKEALADVVAQAAREVGIIYFACRGYVSQSAMYEAGQRFKSWGASGKTNHLLYLGDHDPSGIDMTRDVTERLTMFAGRYAPTVHRVALNMDQVQQYDPPPNPAKVTDSRFEGYQAEHGDESWELDALAPSVLRELITGPVYELRDADLWEAAVEREDDERDQLRDVASNWDRIRDLLEG
jgi:hypothetical protein